jgi:hypothetical protein
MRAGAAHGYRTRVSAPRGFLFPLRSALFVRALRRFLLRFSLAVHALAHGESFGAVSLGRLPWRFASFSCCSFFFAASRCFFMC